MGEKTLSQMIFNGFTEASAKVFGLQAENAELKETIEALAAEIQELKKSETPAPND